MDALKKMLMLMVMVMLSGCGEPPGEAPTVPDPVVWTGSIYIETVIEIASDSTVVPDSVTLTLSGQLLGMIANRDTLSGIAEGSHSLQFEADWGGLTYKSRCYTVPVSYNTVSNISAGLTRSGSLYIEGLYNGVSVPCNIKLGSDTLEWMRQPDDPEDRWVHYHNIPMGVYDLTAFWVEGDTSIEGWEKSIVIDAASTTFVSIDLIDVAPDSGAHAPGMEALDLDGNSWSLADHWGKVIYLYFYEST